MIISYSQAIQDALSDEMKRDKSVFLMGEDIGLYGGAFKVTKGLFDKFGPERVRNTPISEGGIVGLGVGAAITGMRPVLEIMFMDFITLALDQIVNQAAKLSYIYGGQVKVPLVLRTPAGAGRGYGASHAQSLEAWLIHVPGIKVVMPSTPYDAKGLLKSAIRDNSPVMFIEHKLLYATEGEVPSKDYTIPIGKADIKRKGKDLTIITYSRMTNLALEIAEEFSRKNIDIEVLDLRTLLPLDITSILSSIGKTGRAIILEEDCLTGGVGAEVSARIMEQGFDLLDAPVIRIGGEDVPIPCCKDLEDISIPYKEKIVQVIGQTIE